ncbi:MAG: tRNA lysidine(34) synthetase TilS [Clostridiales bacterium]|nr:tRNA lysidine(34) synthetase TilS [Clostridiales bacterium]
MFDGTAGVIVGVSGGADSVCLLLIMVRMSRETGFPLTAVHVEHGIRGEESLSDAKFAEELCFRLGVPFKEYSVDALSYSEKTGQTLEEAARCLRYESFCKACSECGADRVAVAHNADDCAETLLFNLARGTGIRGMAGIKPVSRMPVFDKWEQGDGMAPLAVKEKNDGKDILIIRPLLNTASEEIRSWLDDRDQPWREDSTNADISYSRNRIRLNVMPQLRRINAGAVIHMADMAGQLKEICDFLDEEITDKGSDSFRVIDSGKEGRSIEIYCEPFLKLPPVLQKHLLVYLIGEETGSRKDITSTHVDKLLDLTEGAPGRRISLPYKKEARREYDRVVLYHGPVAGQTRSFAHFDMELAVPGVTETPGGLIFKTEILSRTDVSQKIPKKRYTKWFDYDKIKLTVRIRNRQSGDYMQTTAQGGHRSIKQYFIDEKIAADLRDGIALLADGDQIIWAVGYRISEAYRVTGETRKVLKVTCFTGSQSCYGD